MKVPQNAMVFVVDDDASIRRAVSRLIESVGLRVQTFANVDEFYEAGVIEQAGDGPVCLILDVRMPGISGLELQHQLGRAHRQISIVFITGHGDVPMSVRAMKGGAVDFLPKPFNEQALLDAVMAGIRRSMIVVPQARKHQEVQQRVESLTKREREIFGCVVRGMLNKQIALKLRISEKTVKVHRARVMEKMGAGSLADLVRMYERIQVIKNQTTDQADIADLCW